MFGVGGQNPNNYIENHVPFTGVRFIQSFGFYSTILRMKLQYNFARKLYLTLAVDGGANEVDFEDVFKPESFMFGYGLTLSYDSFVGPVEVSIMGSNMNPDPTFFINIGFFCFNC